MFLVSVGFLFVWGSARAPAAVTAGAHFFHLMKGRLAKSLSPAARPRTSTLCWWACGLVAFGYFVIRLVRYNSANWAEAGTVGDTFGVLNCLFSSLAFLGAVWAILLQRHEMDRSDRRHDDQLDYSRKAALLSVLPTLIAAERGAVDRLGSKMEYKFTSEDTAVMVQMVEGDLADALHRYARSMMTIGEWQIARGLKKLDSMHEYEWTVVQSKKGEFALRVSLLRSMIDHLKKIDGMEKEVVQLHDQLRSPLV